MRPVRTVKPVAFKGAPENDQSEFLLRRMFAYNTILSFKLNLERGTKLAATIFQSQHAPYIFYFFFFGMRLVTEVRTEFFIN